MNLREYIEGFIDVVRSGDTVLYNEAGLQHELGFYLRTRLGDRYVLQLERNVDAVIGEKNRFVKSEMDIYLQDKKSGSRYCIELKVPNSMQIPNRMFMSFQDVQFLEGLKGVGFKCCFFLFVSPNRSYWQCTSADANIYKYFNGAEVEFRTLYKIDVPDFIKKKTDADPIVPLKNIYKARWSDLKKQNGDLWRYFLLEV